jgi:hypothetical protein
VRADEVIAEDSRCPPPREEFGPCRFKDNTFHAISLTEKGESTFGAPKRLTWSGLTQKAQNEQMLSVLSADIVDRPLRARNIPTNSIPDQQNYQLE